MHWGLRPSGVNREETSSADYADHLAPTRIEPIEAVMSIESARPTEPDRSRADHDCVSCSLICTDPFSWVWIMPRSSRSFMTRLTISREAPTTLARSWRETLLRIP